MCYYIGTARGIIIFIFYFFKLYFYFNDFNGFFYSAMEKLHIKSQIKLFVRKQPELLEITTRSSSRKTPILIAALSGSLEAVKCCIELGANLSFHDEEGYNLIHLAAQKYDLKFHINLNTKFTFNKFIKKETIQTLLIFL